MEVEHNYKNADGSFEKVLSFFEVECYGGIASEVKRYAKKGRGVSIVGRLFQRRWKDNEKQMAKLVVIAEKVEFKALKKEAV